MKRIILYCMKRVILYLWQLPQNLLGLLVILLTQAGYKYKCTGFASLWLTRRHSFGVSLGEYIILGETDADKTVPLATVLHEGGHHRQSMYLGPFYLLIIGIPSVCGNIIERIFGKGSGWYYSLPWEAWADRLGGVER